MPDDAGVTLLRQAAESLALSARGFHRTMKVARTIADLDGAPRVGRVHVGEALSYRAEMLHHARAA
jgi:magnesium chelatase family protein